MRRVAVAFALSIGALVFSLPVHASGTFTRTFVSATGVDTNPCTVTQPCASFAVAYAAVAPNGIVAALDPGKYGPLTITGPVTIDGNGWAAITAPVNGNGIAVNAGPTDNVILRGLTIDGANAAAVSGIVFNRGGSLTVTGCVVRNIGSGDDGLDAFNTGSSAMALTVSDSAFINNAGNGMLLLRQGSGALTVSITRTELSGNGFDGIDVDGSAGTGLALTVAVTDSVLAHNAAAGIGADSIVSATTNVTLTAIQSSGNATGVAASDNATVWLAQSTVASNAAGYSAQSSGVINSYGDNYFANNGASTGSLTAASPGKQ
jgi:hypothetical protein